MSSPLNCIRKPRHGGGVQFRLLPMHIDKETPIVLYKKDLPVKIKTQSEDIKMFEKKVNFNAGDRLAHTKWNCKYHMVFAPKYRRKVFF